MDETQKKSHERMFDCYCKKVVRNEARDAYAQMNRKVRREIPMSCMSPTELGMLCTYDTYFPFEQAFPLGGQDVIVCDKRIADALEQLSQKRRDIILASYFLELTDREIGEEMQMIRATVQYQRTQALKELKALLKEEYGDDM